jgi:stage V sporulation protein R
LKLTPELQKLQKEIEDFGREAGLDFFETVFIMVDFNEINSIAALGGFPKRYPHWRFGMEFEKISKSYEYGMSKIYEMVINNDPSYAYLLNSNDLVDQKLVMSHVLGHVDFFKNNYWFSQTNRKMVDQIANHGTRVRRYMDKYGVEKVEEFIDCCLSIENLIDPYQPFQAKKKEKSEEEIEQDKIESEKDFKLPVQRNYMNGFINPKEPKEEIKDIKAEDSYEADATPQRFPLHPERDVLEFLMREAPLEKWESDVLSIIREEAYYFAPQRMTKIMNEGWASYWHSKLMTEKILMDSEVIDYASVCAGVFSTAPGQFNPYKLGIELFRDIKERWDKGMFGKEWDDCKNVNEKKSWDKKLNKGTEKIFEVRKIYNDVQFIDEFFTEDFCVRQGYYKYMFNPQSERQEITSKDFFEVKNQLLTMMTNSGQPIIKVIDGNFRNRSELLLEHSHQGMDLDQNYASETLKNLVRIWKRPVSILTRLEGREKLFIHDGKTIQITDPDKFDPPAPPEAAEAD